MHQRSLRLHWVAAAQIGVLFAVCCAYPTSTHAGPLVLHDGSSETTATAYTIEPVILESEALPLDEAPALSTTIGAAPAKSESAKTAEHVLPPPPADPLMPARPDAAPIAAQAQPKTTAELSIHSVIKESVRPAYDQLVEFGAVDALHELKADLGLNNNQWTDQQKANAAADSSRRWESSSGQGPAQPARTAAQAQLDREMASTMREKLIDQITPWLIGAVVLYAIGYLAKLLHRYMRWRSAKRNQRRSARSQRRASRGTRSSSRTTSNKPTAPPTKVESQDTV